jgi:hypothetical protein
MGFKLDEALNLIENRVKALIVKVVLIKIKINFVII